MKANREPERETRKIKVYGASFGDSMLDDDGRMRLVLCMMETMKSVLRSLIVKVQADAFVL